MIEAGSILQREGKWKKKKFVAKPANWEAYVLMETHIA